MSKLLYSLVLVCASVFVNGEIPNIPYGSDPAQVFDLFLPSGGITNGTKVILLIHGGGWGGGDKGGMAPYVPFLQEGYPGVYVANMEYRLGTHESPGFPKQLEDIGMAIAYIKSSFAAGLDVHFALMGASAGAHLSMLYDYGWDSVADDVKAVVSIVGPTDLNDPNYTEDPVVSELFFALVGPCLYSECPDLYNITSPVTHAHAGSAPTIGFYGNQDPLVPNTQVPLMKAKLDELGVVNKFTVYNAGHADWGWEDQMDMLIQIADFLKSHL